MGWVGDRTGPQGRQRNREDCGELCRSLWIFRRTLTLGVNRTTPFVASPVLKLGKCRSTPHQSRNFRAEETSRQGRQVRKSTGDESGSLFNRWWTVGRDVR